MVAGTQADVATRNQLSLMRLTGLRKTRREKHDGDDEDDDEDDSDSDSDDDAGGTSGNPVLQVQPIVHHGAVNRVRCMPQRPSTVVRRCRLNTSG